MGGVAMHVAKLWLIKPIKINLLFVYPCNYRIHHIRKQESLPIPG